MTSSFLSTSKETRIAVIGAGVIGLTSAVAVQSHFPNVDITIIAEKFGSSTTSHVAAGIFRPSTCLEGPNPGDVEKWLESSYQFYNSVLHSADASDAGIEEVSGYILSSEHPNIVKNKMLENLLPDYRSLGRKELQNFPGLWKYGSFYTTVVVNCNRFLTWLQKRFERNGGKILQSKISTLNELYGKYDVVLNCTGLGAKYLTEDRKLVPIRGQVWKVHAPWIKHFYYGDYDTYIIPGIDHVTLGGTRQFESYQQDIDKHDSASIWERCTSLVPSLKNATIKQEMVGLRPHRSSVRLELEYLKCEEGLLPVIHNYGHGGYGVTLAYGCAKHCTEVLTHTLKLGASKL